jgi:hypothetical protein
MRNYNTIKEIATAPSPSVFGRETETMKEYVEAELEVIEFDTEDVITASPFNTNSNDTTMPEISF